MEIGDLPALGALAAALAAGVVSFASPCVAPLVPGYVAFVAGEQPTRRRSFARASAFVAGFALVFTVLGATAGSLSQAALRYRAEAELAAGTVVALLGLAMVWGHSPLAALTGNRLSAAGPAGRLTARLRAPGTFAGSAAVGAAFAIAWSPCIGPILASILALAAVGEHAGWGALLLLTYSLGLGVPFMLLAIGIDRARRWSRHMRRHTRAIQVVSGLLMIVMGLLIAAGVMGLITGRLASVVSAPL